MLTDEAAIAGDGNCGYRAFAVGLVVAMAELPAHVRQRFTDHLKDLYYNMQHERHLLQCRSPSQGSVKVGYDALLVRYMLCYAVKLACCSMVS